MHILGFADHMVAIATTQFCHCSVKAIIDNIQQAMVVPIKFYLKKQMVSHSLLSLVYRIKKILEFRIKATFDNLLLPVALGSLLPFFLTTQSAGHHLQGAITVLFGSFM